MRAGREADHSPQVVPKLRMRGAIPPLPDTSLETFSRTGLNFGLTESLEIDALTYCLTHEPNE